MVTSPSFSFDEDIQQRLPKVCLVAIVPTFGIRKLFLAVRSSSPKEKTIKTKMHLVGAAESKEKIHRTFDLHQRVRDLIIDERMKRIADLDRQLSELHDQLGELRNQNEQRVSEWRNELRESRNHLMEKKKDGSENSGSLSEEEPRHEDGARRRGDAHGNVHDGGG